VQAVAHIQVKWIYPLADPQQQRLAWIDGEFIFTIKDGASPPKCFISDGHIYLTSGGYTQFFIEDNYVYGPSEQLPWL
jgi:hypothetical protein